MTKPPKLDDIPNGCVDADGLSKAVGRKLATIASWRREGFIKPVGQVIKFNGQQCYWIYVYNLAEVKLAMSESIIGQRKRHAKTRMVRTTPGAYKRITAARKRLAKRGHLHSNLSDFLADAAEHYERSL